MDNFAEQLIKKQMTKSDRIRHNIGIAIGVILTLFFLATTILTVGNGGLFSFLGVILAVFSAVMTYISHRNTKVEYEYTFTNGELDIDKIIAQSKRKEMLTVQVSRFTDFGRYDLSVPEEPDDMTVVYATDNIESHEYFADFQHEDYGSTRLVFCPDKRMLENIRIFLPRELKNKIPESAGNTD